MPIGVLAWRGRRGRARFGKTDPACSPSSPHGRGDRLDRRCRQQDIRRVQTTATARSRGATVAPGLRALLPGVDPVACGADRCVSSTTCLCSTQSPRLPRSLTSPAWPGLHPLSTLVSITACAAPCSSRAACGLSRHLHRMGNPTHRRILHGYLSLLNRFWGRRDAVLARTDRQAPTLLGWQLRACSNRKRTGPSSASWRGLSSSTGACCVPEPSSTGPPDILQGGDMVAPGSLGRNREPAGDLFVDPRVLSCSAGCVFPDRRGRQNSLVLADVTVFKYTTTATSPSSRCRMR